MISSANNKLCVILKKAPKRLNSSRLAVYVYRVQKQVESLILATSPKIAPFKVVHSSQIHINSRNGVYNGDETACEWVFMSIVFGRGALSTSSVTAVKYEITRPLISVGHNTLQYPFQGRCLAEGL